MRFLKVLGAVLLAALAATAGVVMLAVAVAVAAVYLLVQRLRGQPPVIRFGRTLPPRPRPAESPATDVIDVTATDVTPRPQLRS
ncbi:MAG: hypothetical protein B9S34_13785 [Opitutia bacterium Tous-C1TDCM]|nr:MAG: hypothetical protein B9S34_13785 [Opitutae bacterium Tous-C1TDCM]